jgi:hypothetical protein
MIASIWTEKKEERISLSDLASLHDDLSSQITKEDNDISNLFAQVDSITDDPDWNVEKNLNKIFSEIEQIIEGPDWELPLHPMSDIEIEKDLKEKLGIQITADDHRTGQEMTDLIKS